MDLIQTSVILSYAVLLWAAVIALIKTFIAASEVVFARAESKNNRHK